MIRGTILGIFLIYCVCHLVGYLGNRPEWEADVVAIALYVGLGTAALGFWYFGK